MIQFNSSMQYKSNFVNKNRIKFTNISHLLNQFRFSDPVGISITIIIDQ